MSTPIFDSLNAERNFERLAKWTPPAFIWGGRFIVDSNRQTKDVTAPDDTISFKALAVLPLSERKLA